jgi:hypothetical protein
MRETDYFEDLGIYGRILKQILNKWDEGQGLN